MIIIIILGMKRLNHSLIASFHKCRLWRTRSLLIWPTTWRTTLIASWWWSSLREVCRHKSVEPTTAIISVFLSTLLISMLRVPKLIRLRSNRNLWMKVIGPWGFVHWGGRLSFQVHSDSEPVEIGTLVMGHYTAHSIQLALLANSASFTCLLARSLTPEHSEPWIFLCPISLCLSAVPQIFFLFDLLVECNGTCY